MEDCMMQTAKPIPGIVRNAQPVSRRYKYSKDFTGDILLFDTATHKVIRLSPRATVEFEGLMENHEGLPEMQQAEMAAYFVAS
jgi:hypothetical protein